jgi:integrase
LPVKDNRFFCGHDADTDMGQRLTEKLVRDLPAPAKGNRIYYDETLPGFGVRVTAAGHRSFVLNFRTREGRERRLTIGSPPTWSLIAARANAAEHRRRIDAGEDPLGNLQADREAPTMRDLAVRFERNHLARLRHSTVKEYKALITNEILPKLGALKVAAITPADIDKLHRQMSSRAPYRANRLAALLSKLFALGIRWHLRTDNPVQGLTRNHEEKRSRYLTPVELPALTAALQEHDDPQAADIIRLLLLTGARSSEVLSATWEQFDLDAEVWTKPSGRTKQKKEHRVPLSAPAVELLKRIYDGRGTAVNVFPSHRTGTPRTIIKKNWARVCAAARITGLRLHDLRHSYASMLVNEGLSLPVIGGLLGHSRPETTARYAHLQDCTMRAATGKVGQLVTDASKVNRLHRV